MPARKHSLFQDLFDLLFAFHETTRNSKIFKIPNEFHIIRTFSHSKNKIFLTIVAPNRRSKYVYHWIPIYCNIIGRQYH